MSVRAFWNSVKEGVKGIVRHPLVTVASVTTILLMLIIMSSFFIFSTNARTIMHKLGQKPPIEIYMTLQSTPEEREAVANALKADTRVLDFNENSPEENYNSFKDNLGESGSVLDRFDYNTYLPYTFNVRLQDPKYADEVCSDISLYDGVSKATRESSVMNFLTKAGRIVNIASVLAFIVLFMISLFIISNMVRISVYSRSSEIEIMKFVGATNNYIRMPYITEGAIVGMISALCAWGISILAYSRIYSLAMKEIDKSSFYALVPVYKVIVWVLLLSVFMGVLIGSIGSGISVRKYIKV